MAPFLEMRGITKRFPGVVANRDISFTVDRGEIHGLLGENGAGKTTLVNVLYGLLQPDEGTIEIEGRRVAIRGPRDALRHGIGMVHQHFMLVPNMTVAENVALGLRPSGSPLSRIGDVARRVMELSNLYGLEVQPDSFVEDLSVGRQQRVEILKLLYRDAQLLVLDEPTSVLTPPEWKELAAVLRSLVAEGRSVIFITHKLDELLSVADRCTVLRDGALVGTIPRAEADKPSLARMMVGREVVLRVERPPARQGDAVLDASGLTLERPDGRRPLDAVSFSIREGEILGVAGVDGNGQQELVDVLTGFERASEGELRIGGRPIDHPTPAEFSSKLSGAVIPADRHRFALAMDLSLMDNLLMREFGRTPFVRRGFLALGRGRDHAEGLVAEYDVRTPSVDVWMRQLSGGNQQRTVLARELHRSPRFLIAAQPTRGLDVGAMEFVYQRILDHRARGGATLLISTELDEILSLADRIAVMVDGRFIDVIEGGDVDPERLGLLMAGERVLDR